MLGWRLRVAQDWHFYSGEPGDIPRMARLPSR